MFELVLQKADLLIMILGMSFIASKIWCSEK